MIDFRFIHENKSISGTDFIKNSKMSLQSTAANIQMFHFPDSSMDTNLITTMLKSHLYTLSIFETYLKLLQDSQYEKSLAENTLVNKIRPEIYLYDENQS